MNTSATIGTTLGVSGNITGTSLALNTSATIGTTLGVTGNITGSNLTLRASNVGLSITDLFATGSASKSLVITSGTRNVAMSANLGSSSYNTLVTANDSGIVVSGPAQGNAALSIVPWASGYSGIRISSVSNVATITVAATTVNLSATTVNTNNILPFGNANANIGSTALQYNTVFAKATSAQYADLAEYYASDREYEPGTVLIIGGPAEVTESNEDMSSKVVGVVSDKPAYLMNSGLTGIRTPVALVGRVPTKIVGPVGKGDMLVSAPNGYARSESSPKPGTIIGKALEDFTATSEQQSTLIEVIVGKH